MKESLRQHLVCPTCREPLSLTVDAWDGEEIERGNLLCTICKKVFPILHGVPRFVESDAYAKSFSYQWNLHRKTQIDSLAGHDESRKAFALKTGFAESDMKGKLVLDVGCGAGRYMEIAADWGAEVIGVDLSYAVDAAYRNMGRRKGIHVVQADVINLPFRADTFDAIYSVGVLHHTANTRDAFLRLPPLLKPAGVIAVWVYSWAGEYSEFLDRLRCITIHLPKPLLYGLCWTGVPILHAMGRLPLLWRIVRRIPTSDQGRGLRWDVLDTFDLYSPRFQWKHTASEVRDWFQKANLDEVTELAFPVSMRGRRAAV